MITLTFKSDRVIQTLVNLPSFNDSVEKHMERKREIGFGQTDFIGSQPNYLQTNPLWGLRLFTQILLLEKDGQKFKILYFHSLFQKQSHEYKHLEKTKQKLEYLQGLPPTDNEIERIGQLMDNYIKETHIGHKLPTLPDYLLNWTYQKSFNLEKANIFETDEWCSKSAKYTDRHYSICHILYSVINGKAEKINIENGKRNTCLYHDNGNVFLLAEKFATESSNVIWMLYDIYDGGLPSDEEVSKTLGKYEHDLPINQETLIKDARRGYPEYIVIDPDVWGTIQKDKDSNLALSSEEEVLLQNIKYPVFINGQAGSGKTTMLFYLFAHFCRISSEGHPLYLTYNRALLDTARSKVSAILKSYYSFAEGNKAIDTQKISNYFFPFQDFLLKHISDDQRHQFNPYNYISFNRFKGIYYQEGDKDRSLFCNLQEKNKYSAELVWHVIRTFIKGSAANAFLTPTEYANSFRDDHTVDDKTYKEIYNSIWERWYKRIWDEHKCWDDQDLVRFVLTNWESSKSKYPVIFCDESQDFTKIEIEFIIRLSSFVDYDLSYIDAIPLAFAGDPYQSINPTGFRWETVQSIFINELKKHNSANPEIQFLPLKQNYRSKPPIIRFANLLQLCRKFLFNFPDLAPQYPWKKEDGIAPRYYELGKVISGNDLLNYMDNIIIIPEEAGHLEADFCSNDEYLKFLFHKEKELTNIMTASSSKGSEWDRVIIYKFGERCPLAFQKLMEGDEISESEEFEIKHYFDKLYVAATRAKNHLYIFDTGDGYNRFWKYFLDESRIDAWIEDVGNWQNDDITLFEVGSGETKNEIEETNPLSIAEQFEEKGMQNHDSKFLNNAGAYYARAGEDPKSQTCFAYALKFSKQYSKAGTIFLSLGRLEDAAECFWKDANWAEFINTGFQEGILYKSRQYIAGYMHSTITVLELINSDVSWTEYVKSSEITAKIIFDKIISELSTLAPGWSILEKRSAAIFARQMYATFVNVRFAKIAADLSLSLGQYSEAIKIWEEIGDTSHKNYYISKAEESHDINEKVFWLSQIKGDHHLLLGLFDKHRIELTENSLRIIYTKLRSGGKSFEALNIPAFNLNQRVNDLLHDKLSHVEYKRLITVLAEFEPIRESIKVFEGLVLTPQMIIAANNFLNEKIIHLKGIRELGEVDLSQLRFILALLHKEPFTEKYLNLFMLALVSIENFSSSTSAIKEIISAGQKIDFAEYFKQIVDKEKHEWEVETWDRYDVIQNTLDVSMPKLLGFYESAMQIESEDVRRWAIHKTQLNIQPYLKKYENDDTVNQDRKYREIYHGYQKIIEQSQPIPEILPTIFKIEQIQISSEEFSINKPIALDGYVKIPNKKWDFTLDLIKQKISLYNATPACMITITPKLSDPISIFGTEVTNEGNKFTIGNHNVEIQIDANISTIMIDESVYTFEFLPS